MSRVLLRVIVDPPAHGAWNMAVDEAVLAAAAEENIATLRFYQWNEPTLSLGYFQRYEDRLQHAASRNCAVVRRPSGGGAILHDRELTYSLTLPAGHPLARDAAELYRAIHAAFVRLLTPLMQGAEAQWQLAVHETVSPRSADPQPFLCFQRRARGDLMLTRRTDPTGSAPARAAHKIMGSAQRRHRGAILQHGSLLLQRSPAAPELPGWVDLTSGSTPIAALVSDLPGQLAAVLAPKTERSALSEAIRDAAQSIQWARYATESWTCRR